MPVLPIILTIPLIEIAVFIAVGEAIGLLNTLILCILAAVAGSTLLRAEGLRTLFEVQNLADRGEMPVRALFDGICLAGAGMLLIIPGFVSDLLAFALMIPAVRGLLRQWLIRHYGLADIAAAAEPAIDAEFTRLDDPYLEGPDKDRS